MSMNINLKNLYIGITIITVILLSEPFFNGEISTYGIAEYTFYVLILVSLFFLIKEKRWALISTSILFSALLLMTESPGEEKGTIVFLRYFEDGFFLLSIIAFQFAWMKTAPKVNKPLKASVNLTVPHETFYPGIENFEDFLRCKKPDRRFYMSAAAIVGGFIALMMLDDQPTKTPISFGFGLTLALIVFGEILLIFYLSYKKSRGSTAYLSSTQLYYGKYIIELSKVKDAFFLNPHTLFLKYRFNGVRIVSKDQDFLNILNERLKNTKQKFDSQNPKRQLIVAGVLLVLCIERVIRLEHKDEDYYLYLAGLLLFLALFIKALRLILKSKTS